MYFVNVNYMLSLVTVQSVSQILYGQKCTTFMNTVKDGTANTAPPAIAHRYPDMQDDDLTVITRVSKIQGARILQLNHLSLQSKQHYLY